MTIFDSSLSRHGSGQWAESQHVRIHIEGILRAGLKQFIMKHIFRLLGGLLTFCIARCSALTFAGLCLPADAFAHFLARSCSSGLTASASKKSSSKLSATCSLLRLMAYDSFARPSSHGIVAVRETVTVS